MSRNRLIDVQYIKDYSPLNDNLPNKYIEVAIDLAMDKDLRQLIGTEFYDDLISKINALPELANGEINYTTLQTSYITLIEKLEFKNFLLWAVLSQGTLWMQYKYQAKSIAKKGGDGAETADNYSLDKLQDEAKNNAEFYGQRLLYWLRDNSSTYTLLENNGDIESPRTAYDSGIFTGNKRPIGRINNQNTRYPR